MDYNKNGRQKVIGAEAAGRARHESFVIWMDSVLRSYSNSSSIDAIAV